MGLPADEANYVAQTYVVNASPNKQFLFTYFRKSKIVNINCNNPDNTDILEES